MSQQDTPGTLGGTRGTVTDPSPSQPVVLQTGQPTALPVDLSADRVQRASGLLAEFNAAGILGAADVHTAATLCRLHGEDDPEVALAAALAVRALRGGSICVDLAGVAEATFDIDLDEQLAAPTVATAAASDPRELPWPEPLQWQEKLAASPLVSTSTETLDRPPLRLVDGLLYLQRYWAHQERVRQQLTSRLGAERPAPASRLQQTLDALFDSTGLPDQVPDQQRLAGAMAALNPVTVIAGGPGTGKTTTVAKILALLAELDVHAPTVALAAPTGKAAARLGEAVTKAAKDLGEPWTSRVGEVRPSTLHRLLGSVWKRTRFKHTASNPLPHDVIVVDEMSMVSLTMMDRLLDAIRPDAKLILLGDPDQLVSVEAGAVLADIVKAPLPVDPELGRQLARLDAPGRPAATPTSAGVVTLQHTWRFADEGGIDQLARSIRAGDPEGVIRVLQAGLNEVLFVETDEAAFGHGLLPRGAAGPFTHLADLAVESGQKLHRAALAGDVESAVAAMEEHRVLCGHRRGPWGVNFWGRQVLSWLQEAIPGYGHQGDWYPGLPVIVNSNDNDAGLYNGDTGVLVETDDGLRAAFARGDSPLLFSTIALDSVTPVHAMTVHKSQGSQFRELSLILPPVDSPLLTRELFYTAATRAREKVTIYGTLEAVRRAVENPVNRASGLAGRLAS